MIPRLTWLGRSIALTACLVGQFLTTNAQISPLAHFRFEGNAVDSTGINPPMQVDGGIFRNGILDLSEDVPLEFYSARASLPELNYENFTVAFDFKPHSFNYPHWNLISGGPSHRWFGLATDDSGQLKLTLNNSNFAYFFTNIIATGQWHTIVCTIDLPNRRGLVFLDGKQLPEVSLPGSLEVIGSDAEPFDRVFSFWNYGNATSFSGEVDNLRVFRRALNYEEVAAIFSPSLAITTFEENAFLFWSADLTGYVPETKSAMEPSLPWIPIPQSPITIGNHKILINAATSPHTFYRLNRRPD